MHAIRTRPFPGFRAAAHEGDRPVVMVVQNDADTRQHYAEVLCYNGFNVMLVSDAAAARKVVELLVPDLIVVDLELPRGQGLQLCGLEAATSRGARVPVLALGEEGEKSAARAAGCSYYVPRPFTPVTLLHNVEGLLGRPPAPGDEPSPWLITYPIPGGR